MNARAREVSVIFADFLIAMATRLRSSNVSSIDSRMYLEVEKDSKASALPMIPSETLMTGAG